MAGQKEKLAQTRESMEILQEISNLLNTGLDTETLAICVRLIEQGVNPEALALVVKELRREREELIKEGNLPGGDGSLA